MKVYFAAAELAPFAKVGGLGDVVGSLPKALKALGTDVTILFPHYADLQLEGAKITKTNETIRVKLGKRTEEIIISQTTLPGSSVPVLLFGHDAWIGNGGVYAKTPVVDFPNINPELPRFALFSIAVAEYVAGHEEPDTILHAHDWHLGLATALLGGELKSAHVTTLHTIHNLAYQLGYGIDWMQEVVGDEILHKLPKEAVMQGTSTEWFNFLLAAILTADWVSTVSPSYRNEILTDEYSAGLTRITTRREDRLVGIVNGIDTARWNPEDDPLIKAHYSLKDPSGKRDAKRLLQKAVSLPENPSAPLFAMVTRLSEQKGFDIFNPAIPEMLESVEGLQLVVLATGDPQYSADLKAAEERYPNRFAFVERFDEGLAHEIYAGADAFFMPSRFEPCGLGQLFAMRYGTLPIARSTGGLKDTVTDGETGFRFDDYTSEALVGSVTRAATVYRDDPDAWAAMIKNAMAYDSSWDASAKEYVKLYERLVSS